MYGRFQILSHELNVIDQHHQDHWQKFQQHLTTSNKTSS